MKTTWTRLKDGTWGLRIEGAASTGDVLTVARANGSKSRETVGDIVWTGNGVTLAKLGKKAPKKPAYNVVHEEAGRQEIRMADGSYMVRYGAEETVAQQWAKTAEYLQAEHERDLEADAQEAELLALHNAGRLNNDADLPF